MIQIEDLIDIAIEKEASDIHLICGMKPMLRIIRRLEPIEEYDKLSQEDMYEIYDSLVRGNLDKDNVFYHIEMFMIKLNYEKKFRYSNIYCIL